MTKRFQISIPNDAATALEQLAADSGLPQSVVITQLIRRHGPQFRQLFAIDCNQLQPTATSVQPDATSVLPPDDSVQPTATDCNLLQPIATLPKKPKHTAFFDD